MNRDFDITCATCMVTISGNNRDAVMVAYRGHEKEAHGFMTGREYYDRTIKAIEQFNYEHRGSIDIYLSDDLNDVLRQVAGLENI